LIGAGAGLLGGLYAKSEMEQQTQSDAERQKKIDQELERQVASQPGGGAAVVAQATPPPAAGHGLSVVKDHLAEEPARPEAAGARGGAAPGVVIRGRAAPSASGPAGSTTPSSSAQGLIVVKDHLAEEPARPEAAGARGGAAPGVAAVEDHLAGSRRAPAPGSPPPAPASPAAGQGPALARAPSDGLDAEGFRAIYEGGRLVRRERDANGDGAPDVIVYYGEDGQPVRREESSRLDGRIDTWTYYAHGQIERKESDTDGDGTVDLWAYYGPQGDLARLDSLVDPRRRVAQFYAGGKVVAEEWWREPRGPLQARLTYRDGVVAQKEEDSTGSGRLDRVSFFDGAGRLVRQGHKDGDGQFVAWRYFDAQGTLTREEELGKDGAVVAVSHYENGRLARRAFYELDDRLIQRVPLLSDGEPASGG